MSEGFRVPKREVPVRLKLAGQAPVEVFIYLARLAERHTGIECPSDLLNRGDAFIPATDYEGRIMIFRRSAVMLLTVNADNEGELAGDTAGEDDRVVRVVRLGLEDGTMVTGDLTYWRPDGQRRVQDFLNTSEAFIALREDNVIHLVNRDRIVSLSEE
jgi:hypothetical protein